jgi:hypothetical protein
MGSRHSSNNATSADGVEDVKSANLARSVVSTSASTLQASQAAADVPLTSGAFIVGTISYLTIPGAGAAAGLSADDSQLCNAADQAAVVKGTALPCLTASHDDTSGAALRGSIVIDLEAGLPQLSFPDWSQQSTNMCSSMAFMNVYCLLAQMQRAKEESGDSGGSSSSSSGSGSGIGNDGGAEGAVDAEVGEGGVPSATYAYYWQRVNECTAYEGTCKCPSSGQCQPPCLDCGSYLRSAADVFGRGVAPITAWPLTTALSAMNTTPSIGAERVATLKTLTTVECRVSPQSPVSAPLDTSTAMPSSSLSLSGIANAMLNMLTEERHPIVAFFTLNATQAAWMESVMNRSVAPSCDALFDVILPTAGNRGADNVGGAALHGHVMVIDGVVRNIASQLLYVIVRNSFGLAWGVQGRCLVAANALNPSLIHSWVAVQAVA